MEGYFAMGKASKALVLSADKNSAYYNETDPRRAIYGVMPPPLSLSPRSGSVRATRDRRGLHARSRPFVESDGGGSLASS